MANQKPKAKKAAKNPKAVKSVKPAKKSAAKTISKPVKKIAAAARPVAPKHSPLSIRIAAVLGVGVEEAVERAVHELAEKLGLHNVGSAQTRAQSAPAHAPTESQAAPAAAETRSESTAKLSAEARDARPAAEEAKPAASQNAIGKRPAKSAVESSEAKSSVGKLIPRHELDLTPLPARTSSAASPTLQYSPTSLPRRLYLELDGRMPLEVVDLPCTLGSSRRNTIWINSPRIETHHAQIIETDEGWVFEDLGSEHGTVFDGERIGRRVLQNGDTFLLAGYLRLKAELR